VSPAIDSKTRKVSNGSPTLSSSSSKSISRTRSATIAKNRTPSPIRHALHTEKQLKDMKQESASILRKIKRDKKDHPLIQRIIDVDMPDLLIVLMSKATRQAKKEFITELSQKGFNDLVHEIDEVFFELYDIIHSYYETK
jgi:hypothetical protein